MVSRVDYIRAAKRTCKNGTPTTHAELGKEAHNYIQGKRTHPGRVPAHILNIIKRANEIARIRLNRKPRPTHFQGTTAEVTAMTDKAVLQSLRRAGLDLRGTRGLAETKFLKAQVVNTKQSKIVVINTTKGMFPIKITKLHSGKVFVHAEPLIHDIGIRTNIHGKRALPFDSLLTILSQGMRSREGPNFEFLSKLDNRIVGYTAGNQPKTSDGKTDFGHVTYGDCYSVEFIAPFQKEFDQPQPERWVTMLKHSTPNQVRAVNVYLNTYHNTPEQIEAKQRFYKKEITGKFGKPVRFINSQQQRRKSFESRETTYH